MPLYVNGERVDPQAIEAEAKSLETQITLHLPAQPREQTHSQARDWARDNVIERILLEHAAIKHFASEPAADPHDLNAQVGQFIQIITAATPIPGRREVVDFYNSHRTNYRAPESFHASHIVKNVDEQHPESDALIAINSANAELTLGEAFEQVADRYSDCPGNGGAVGWFLRGEMVEEFETALLHLRPSQMSGIFRSEFGFHIAKLHARKPVALRPLSEVFDQVKSDLLTERRQSALNDFLDQARASSIIEDRPA